MSAAAQVAPAVDSQRLAREIAREHVALQDCDRQLEQAERKTDGLREQQRRHRVEIGRLLIEAKRVTKHGQWLSYLEKCGVDQQRASEWMRLAGYSDATPKSPALENVGDFTDSTSLSGSRTSAPTLADAGIDKRPRKSEQPDEPPPRLNDLEGALMGLDKMIMKYAKSWPRRSRVTLAQTLRSVADRIERMLSE